MRTHVKYLFGVVAQAAVGEVITITDRGRAVRY